MRPTASSTCSRTPTPRSSCSTHHPNLVLLRTFSKVHGLCGLRVGFALCGSEELPRALDQVRQPFFCNALAQAAAVEALAHQDAVEDRVDRTVAERISVDERLRALGLEPADSQANFCWFELGDGARRAGGDGAACCERGVLVRGGGALGSQTPALRVTYGTPEENARFLDALAEVLRARRALSAARLRPATAPRCGWAPNCLPALDRGAVCLLQTLQTTMHASALTLRQHPVVLPYLFRLAIYLGASALTRA